MYVQNTPTLMLFGHVCKTGDTDIDLYSYFQEPLFFTAVSYLIFARVYVFILKETMKKHNTLFRKVIFFFFWFELQSIRIIKTECF